MQFVKLLCTQPIVWFTGDLPVFRHESGSETDVMRILEYLRKLVSALLGNNMLIL